MKNITALVCFLLISSMASTALAYKRYLGTQRCPKKNDSWCLIFTESKIGYEEYILEEKEDGTIVANAKGLLVEEVMLFTSADLEYWEMKPKTIIEKVYKTSGEAITLHKKHSHTQENWFLHKKELVAKKGNKEITIYKKRIEKRFGFELIFALLFLSLSAALIHRKNILSALMCFISSAAVAPYFFIFCSANTFGRGYIFAAIVFLAASFAVNSGIGLMVLTAYSRSIANKIINGGGIEPEDNEALIRSYATCVLLFLVASFFSFGGQVTLAFTLSAVGAFLFGWMIKRLFSNKNVKSYA